jgi:hypothetical protein
MDNIYHALVTSDLLNEVHTEAAVNPMTLLPSPCKAAKRMEQGNVYHTMPALPQ